MLSDKWCYHCKPNAPQYDVLHVSRPISKKQAIFILKKRLKIQNIFYIIDCNQAFRKGDRSGN